MVIEIIIFVVIIALITIAMIIYDNFETIILIANNK